MRRYKSLEYFADAMQRKLNANAHKGGWGKGKCELGYLIQRLAQEIREWEKSQESDPKELVDIANICMMLYSRRRELYGCGSKCVAHAHGNGF